MKCTKYLCAAALVAMPQLSHALLLDFSQVIPGGKQGNLGVSSYAIPNSPVSVEAFYQSGNSYTQKADSKGRPVTLFVRNEDDDLGFGVCAPEDQSKSACAAVGKYKGGGGDTNELDNEGQHDLLRFKLNKGWTWDNVKFSTLSKDEGGQLWYSNTPGTSSNLASFASLFKAYSGTSSHFLTLNLDGTPAADATYLYFVPTGNDAGHMIWQMNVSQVPEPATAGLLAAGLGVLGALRLRRTR